MIDQFTGPTVTVTKTLPAGVTGHGRDGEGAPAPGSAEVGGAGTPARPTRRSITVAGRVKLADAVSVDKDWGLPHSSVDLFIEMLSGLSTSDLESAGELARHLDDAVACLLIRRWNPTHTADDEAGPR